MLKIKNLQWRRYREVGTFVCVVNGGRGNEYRVAMLRDERLSSLLPKHVRREDIPQPWQLEIYFPLPVGMDKMQRFDTDSEARAIAALLLAKFIGETAEGG